MTEKTETPNFNARLAIQRDEKQALSNYLTNKGDPNLISDDYNPILIEAIEAGKGWAISMLINHGVDLQLPDKFGRSPLALACSWTSKNEVKLLVEAGARPTEKELEKFWILIDCFDKDHVEAIDYLLKNKIIRATSPSNGENIWKHAKAEIDFVRLIEMGVDLNPQMATDGTNALHHAAGKGYSLLVRRLIKKGLDPNGRDQKGNTPLMWAAKKGQTAVCKILLDHGAIITSTNKAKKEAWHLAVNGKHQGTITFLSFLRMKELEKMIEVSEKPKPSSNKM